MRKANAHIIATALFAIVSAKNIAFAPRKGRWTSSAIVDTFSRRVIGFEVFESAPKSEQMRAFFARCIRSTRCGPKYLVSDKGSQFTDEAHRAWCIKQGIRLRYASTGSLRATAIIERFFRSLKSEWLRRITIPLRAADLRREIQRYLAWFHAHRPHQGLGGKTPTEVFEGNAPANEAPRFEPRKRWPRKAPCAQPAAKPRRDQGGRIVLKIEYADPGKKLPVIRLDRAA